MWKDVLQVQIENWTDAASLEAFWLHPPAMQLSTSNILQFASRLLPIDCCLTERALGRCWALTFRPPLSSSTNPSIVSD